MNEFGFTAKETVLIVIVMVQWIFLLVYVEKANRLERSERERALGTNKPGSNRPGNVIGSCHDNRPKHPNHD